MTLETPCADLDLAAVRLAGDVCPGPNSRIPVCDMWPKEGTITEKVEIVSWRTSTWWLIVGGKEADGAYRLSVDCRPGIE